MTNQKIAWASEITRVSFSKKRLVIKTMAR